MQIVKHITCQFAANIHIAISVAWNIVDVIKAKIESTAQAILDARNKYPECSLADMYGEKMYLFPELMTAHQKNDRAVMEAYGFWGRLNSESECVAELMKMYQALVSKEK